MAAPVHDPTQNLQRLAEITSHPGALGSVFEGALQSLSTQVPFELAALYELDGDALRVRAAAGPLASAAVGKHELSLAKFPTIRAALKSRRPVALDEGTHSGEEGDPYRGIVDLPAGHACMVVPLFVADRNLGVITLDKSATGAYDESTLALAAMYGQLVSIAMAYAQQVEQLQTAGSQLLQHNALLKKELSGAARAIDRLSVGSSASMVEAIRLAQQVGPADAPVLIHGETGSGKELFARAIHELSPRSSQPFVKLNCAATSHNLVDSQLLGREGHLVTANGGTLLLDEVADLPLATQAKLLKVLEDGELQPSDDNAAVRVSVRVLASSHTDLQEAVTAGRFNEALYSRIAVFPLAVPPLRDRAQDMGLLAESILAGFAEKTGAGPWSLTGGAVGALQQHTWPGNVRQLVNVLERATLVVQRGLIGPEDLGLERASTGTPAVRATATRIEQATDILPWRDAERRHLMAALHATGGKIYGNDGAAQLLDLKPTTLQSKLKKHGIDRSMV